MSADSDAILARLLELHPKVIDLSLDRMHRLLAALGNPEKKLPPVIHIAGTNGKGSTLAMVRAGLEAAGQKVHAYISPHLAYFHERIYLAGHSISEAELASILSEVENINDGEPITFFEVTTAAAMLAFSRIPADYLILEVGLGGRLDATNVMTPALSIITPISLDHQSYLGDRLEDIAFEKAGILKENVPAIIGKQLSEAEDVIAARAEALGAPLTWQDQDFQSYAQNGRFVFQNDQGLWDLPMPALPGAHQIDNGGIALAALQKLGLRDDVIMEKALTQAQWPARMQRLKAGSLIDAANGAEIWLDGGHNPAAGKALAAHLAQMPDKPLLMIVGMLNTKDVSGYLENFIPLKPTIYGVSIEGEVATLSAKETVDIARTLGIDAHPAKNALDAIQTSDAIHEKRVLICGSLYLAGRILRENA